jgi:hypothetical protein
MPDGSRVPKKVAESALLGAFEMVLQYLEANLEEKLDQIEQRGGVHPFDYMLTNSLQGTIKQLEAWAAIVAREVQEEEEQNGIQFAGTVDEFLARLERTENN